MRSIFEAAGAAEKIVSSLKSNHQIKLSLPKSMILTEELKKVSAM